MRLFGRGPDGDERERVEQLLEEAGGLLDDDDAIEALRRLDRAAAMLRRRSAGVEAELAAAVHTLRATALNDCGRFAEAAAAAAAACESAPEDGAAWYERAVAAYRRALFDDAEHWYRTALRLEPGDAPAWHGLGRALLWQDREAEADEALRRAAELEPGAFVRPVHLPTAEFDRLAGAAWEAVPPAFRRRLSNALVVVEALPDADDVAGGFDPDTLGLYEGATALEEGMPERIVLFQRNHELVCGGLGELREEIRRTMLHEVGHHFGMEEADLPY